MNADQLLANYERVAGAPKAVQRLRSFILDLAVHGKLVPQDPNDVPASELLKQIALEKAQLAKVRKIRRINKPSLIDDRPLLFEAPLGWVWTRLSDMSRKIHYGFTASANHEMDDIRLLRITDIQNNKVKWQSIPGCEIDKEALLSFKLEAGDILIARTGGTIGKSFLVNELPVVAVFASYLIRVQVSHEIYDRFLKFFMESPIYWMQLQEGARGAGQLNVNGQTLGAMLVPLPPLAEQHRIVAKVDELMALCDQLEAARVEREATRNHLTAMSLARLNTPDPDLAVFQNHAVFTLENLDHVTARRDQIEAFRQTILNLAVHGKLVPQDPNDVPASELLKQIALEKAQLAKVRKIRRINKPSLIDDRPLLFEAPLGWVWTRLSDMSRKIHYGFTASANHEMDDIRLLRITDIQNNKVKWQSIPGCEIDKEALLSFKLEAGDILIARTGGTIGKSFLVNELPVVAVFASYLIRVQVSHEIYDRFLKFFMESPIYWMQLQEGARGAGQLNVNGQTLGAMLVPLPPLAEQHRIVAKVDELMALCDQLEVSLATVDDTRRQLLDALLHEALEPATTSRNNLAADGTSKAPEGTISTG